MIELIGITATVTLASVKVTWQIMYLMAVYDEPKPTSVKLSILCHLYFYNCDNVVVSFFDLVPLT